MEELRKKHKDTPNKPIVLILDNAPYNKSYQVRDRAEQLNIRLEFLPPYCPNLNLIERLWKFFKKKVVTNKYYEKFSQFDDAIYDFFANISNYQQELKSLLTLNFEIIKAI